MLYLIMFLPVIAGLVVPRLWRTAQRRTVYAFLLTMQSLEAIAVVFTVFSGRQYSSNVWKITEDLTIGFRMDEVSKLFCLPIVLSWLLAFLFSYEYMKHAEGKEGNFYAFLFLSEGMLLCTSLAADFVSMYLFYELTSLSSMPLVLYERTKAAITGALKYLYYSIGGAFFVLFGIVVLYSNTSTLDFKAGGTLLLSSGDTGLVLAAVFCVILGFGTKAGLFPMHNWLPSAHPVAPAPASALLSGIITKAGVIGIVRVIFFVAGADNLRGTWVQTTCLVLALLTVFMGSMMAYAEKDFKKRLAYSSISQISYVLTGFFLLSREGLGGGLLQVVFHASAKIGLFFVAGTIICLAGVRNVDDFRGLGRRMPVTFGCFALLSLSLVGIPPFGGFWSKWYIASAALNDLPGAMGYIAPAVLLVSALLTAGYLFPPVIRGFFPGEGFALRPKLQEPPSLTAPMLILSACCGVLGFFPDFIISAMQRIAGSVL
jgi:multicomponent Na+:H+ antiporter subunit D